MAIGMSLLNYLLFLPMYTYFMNFPSMAGSELTKYIVLGVLPFNLIKGIMLIIISMLLFKSMNKWITQQRSQLMA
jgi:riboflavin transporter